MNYVFPKSATLFRVDLISEYTFTEQYHYKLNGCWMLFVVVQEVILQGTDFKSIH